MGVYSKMLQDRTGLAVQVRRQSEPVFDVVL